MEGPYFIFERVSTGTRVSVQFGLLWASPEYMDRAGQLRETALKGLDAWTRFEFGRGWRHVR